ncbi:ferritin family protein [Brevibacillus borstelensis]|uniref:ferritin family protein n=1 Tax=Brevibacillus borstelensis TaxID=45462 RepID=UPI0030BBBD1A
MYRYPTHYAHWPLPVQDGGRRKAVDTADRTLAEEVLKAVHREERAGNFYTRLAELAPTESVRVLITIIKDERLKHLQNFSRLYSQLTGREPQLLREPVPTPESFQRGVELAIRDELEAVDSYRDFAERTADPSVRKAFQRAAADEQRHSTWYANILLSQQS